MSGIGDRGPLGPSSARPDRKNDSLSDPKTVPPANTTSDTTDADAARLAALLNGDGQGSDGAGADQETVPTQRTTDLPRPYRHFGGGDASPGDGGSEANDLPETEDVVYAGPATASLAPRTAAPPKVRRTMAAQTEINATESGPEEASTMPTPSSVPSGSQPSTGALADGPAQPEGKVAYEARTLAARGRIDTAAKNSSSDTPKTSLSAENTTDRPITDNTDHAQDTGTGDTGSDDQTSSQSDGDGLATVSGLATPADQALDAEQTTTITDGQVAPEDREEVERLVATFVDSIRVSGPGENADRLSITLSQPSRFAGASVNIERADGGLTLSFENLSQDLVNDLEGIRGQIADRLESKVGLPITLSFDAGQQRPEDTARQETMPPPVPTDDARGGDQRHDGRSRNRREMTNEEDEDG